MCSDSVFCLLAPQEKRDSIVGSLFKYLIPTGKKKEAHLPSDKDKRVRRRKRVEGSGERVEGES